MPNRKPCRFGINLSTCWSLVRQAPIDRCLSHLSQNFVALCEVSRCHKACIDWKWRRMGGLKNMVPTSYSMYLLGSTALAFSCAGFPQSKNTTSLHCSLIILMTSSVNLSQPHLAWELGLLSSTVREVLSRNTPCSAHLVRSPCFGALKCRDWSDSKFL